MCTPDTRLRRRAPGAAHLHTRIGQAPRQRVARAAGVQHKAHAARRVPAQEVQLRQARAACARRAA